MSYKGTAYYDMAIDAGCRGEEAEQLAAAIEEEHRRQFESQPEKEPPANPVKQNVSCQGGVDISDLRVGQKVHYQPSHYSDNEFENGIIKVIREGKTDGVWVVYNCAGEWDRYYDYTGALTNLRDLKLGWRE